MSDHGPPGRDPAGDRADLSGPHLEYDADSSYAGGVIVTFSRQAASRGEQVAQRVAQALNYPLVDAEVVQRAAYRISLHSENLADAERAERLGKRLAALVIDLHDEPPDDVDWALTAVPAMSDPGYRRVIETMLREVSLRDGVVLAGYPGRFVIDRSIHAVHALVVAPFATRVQRMVLREDLPFRTAERVLREADRDRAEFYRRYYGVQWDDPALYDCVLNTARLGLDHAAAVAVALVQARA